jgi:hypothetical protein
MKGMKSLFFTCVTALCLLPGPMSAVLAAPQSYHFTSIAETSTDGFASFISQSLSMNNKGTVAFYGGLPQGDKKIVLTGNGQRPKQQPTATFPILCYFVAKN